MKSKKRLLGILLIMAMAIVSIFAIAACDDEKVQDVRPEAGPESGLYLSIVGGHAIQLYGGNSFTLAFGDEDNIKFGQYTLTDTVLTFDFEDEAFPGVVASLENQEINLTAFNRTTRFLKQVDRTVSFNSHQGSSVAALEVMNGNPVPVGAMVNRTPTRAGHIFIGWYLDAAGTLPFEFGVNIVDRNLTLHAFWAVDTGAESYAIDFNWGIAGQENPASTQTINGRVYNLPSAIARAGYTFGGWWVSMTENAAQLTYQVVARNTIFNESATLHALWTPVGAPIAAPVLQVSRNGAISWGAVAGVSTYTINVINPYGASVLTGGGPLVLPVGTTDFEHNFVNIGNYRVELSATGPAGTSATTVRHFRHRALARVSNFSVVNNTLVFSQVANADRYIVTVAGRTQHTRDIGNTNRVPFNSCEMVEGGIVFSVEARANGFASSVGTFVFRRDLGTISQINIDAATQTASWGAVASAENYVVSIRRGTAITRFDNDASTSFDLREQAIGDLEISVVAEAQGYNSGAAVWVPFAKATIATPANVRLDGNTVRWNAVAGAANYTVQIGPVEFNVAGADTNQYTLSTYQIAQLRTQIGSYDLSVRANAAVAASSSLFSVPVSVVNVMPDITYFRGEVLWTHVLGASRYTIIVNGVREYEVDAGFNASAISLTRAGYNSISFMVYDLNDQPISHFREDTSVFAYAVRFDIGGNGALAPEDAVRFLAFGDPVDAFPVVDAARIGHDFDTWYWAPGGPAHNARRFADRFFMGGDTVLFANWAPHVFNINLVYGDGSVDSDTANVVFGQFGAIEVPSVNGNGFIGWFTAEDGEGVRITDERGYMIAAWDILDADDISLYAFYATVFQFGARLDMENVQIGYVVSSGVDAHLIRHMTLPNYFNGYPVIEVGVINHLLLETIIIGANIGLYSVSPELAITAETFDGCRNLTHIHVHPQNPFFMSANGILFNHNGTMLVRYPTGRTGRFSVPASVNTIGSNAFRDNFYLEVIEIPSTVHYIRTDAFTNNLNMSTIVLQEGLRRIENNAFGGLPSLTELVIPRNLQFLGALRAMPALASITFTGGSSVDLTLGGFDPDDIAQVGGVGGVFEGAPLLGTVIFEEGSRVVNIPNHAFLSNGALTEFVVPATVRTIGLRAFEAARYLTTFTVPNNSVLESIGTGTFTNTTSLTDIVFEGSTQMQTIVGAMTMTGANASPFAGAPNLRTLVLPSGLTSVGIRAFENMPNLTTLTFRTSPNFETIGQGAFNGLPSLQHLTLPAMANADQIDGARLAQLGNLRTINLVDTGAAANFAMHDGALYNGTLTNLIMVPIARGQTDEGITEALRTLTLAPATSTIDPYAIFNIPNLTTFVVPAANTTFTAPNGVLTRGNTIVRYPTARAAASFTVPANITHIGENAFRFARYLNEVVFASGTGIIEIGHSAFRQMPALVRVNFSYENNTLTTIGAYAFADSTNHTIFEQWLATRDGITRGDNWMRGAILGAVTLDWGTTVITEGQFSGATLPSIEIPYTVTHIHANAFLNAETLTHVSFVGRPAGVTTGPTSPQLTYIGAEAFRGTALAGFNSGLTGTAINIPVGVETIGVRAFYNASNINMTRIYIPGTVTSLGDSAFQRAGARTYGPGIIDIEFGARPSGSTAELVMGEAVFANMIRLRTVTFHADSYVTNIGARAFEYTLRGAQNHTAANNPDLFEGNDMLPVPAAAGQVWGQPFDITFNRDIVFNTITIPRSVRYIGERAFRGTALGINRTNRAIADFHAAPAAGNAPYNNRNANIVPVGLTEVIFEGGDVELGSAGQIMPGGSNLYRIGVSAFEGAGIETITFPHSLRIIEDRAFRGYNPNPTNALVARGTLTGRLYIGQNVESIGVEAFAANSLLSGIILNHGLETIDTRAFYRIGIVSPYTMAHAYLFDNILGNPDHADYNPNRAATQHMPAVRTGLLTERPQYIYEGNVNTGRIDTNTIQNWHLVIPNTVTYIGYRAFRDAFVGGNAAGAVVDAVNAVNSSVTAAHVLAETGIAWNRRVSRIFIGEGSNLRTMQSSFDGMTGFVGTFDDVLYVPKTLEAVSENAFGNSFGSFRGTLIIDPGNLTYVGTSLGTLGQMSGPFRGSGFSVLEIAEGTTHIQTGLFAATAFYDLYIPASVQTMGIQAFNREQGTASRTINTLTFGEGSQLTGMSDGTFNWLSNRYINTIYNLPGTIAARDVFNIFGGRVHAFDTTYDVLPAGVRRAVDGVLYSHDGTVLEIFPSARTGHFTVPATVVGTTPVAHIGPHAFAGGANLVPAQFSPTHGSIWPLIEEITLPNSIATIGESAFRNARELEAVNLSMADSNLVSIGHHAFYNNTGLESFVIPTSLRLSGLSLTAFTGTRNLNYVDVYLNHPDFAQGDFSINNRATGEILFVTANRESIKIPYSMTTIPGGLFANRTMLQRVYIHPRVTAIGAGAFDGATGLTQVIFTDTFDGGAPEASRLVDIGNAAFRGTRLNSIELPSSLVTIGVDAFRNIPTLSRVGFESGSQLQIIGANAFTTATGSTLREFDFASLRNLLQIGDGAFQMTMIGGDIVFPASLMAIGMSAFLQTPITTITFEDNNHLDTIHVGAFNNIGSLRSVNFGANSALRVVANTAFGANAQWQGLMTYMYLPSRLEEWGNDVFSQRHGVEALRTHADSVNFTSVDGVLLSRDETVLVSLPRGRRRGETYIVPSTVTTIAEGAIFFNGVAPEIRNIIFPNNVTRIESHAIHIGSNVSIFVNPYLNSVSQAAFGNLNAASGLQATLHVNMQGRADGNLVGWHEAWQNGTFNVHWAQPTNNVAGIVYTANGNGTLRAATFVANGQPIASGSNTIASQVVFSAVPGIGYRLSEWRLNDEVVAGNTTNTFATAAAGTANNVTVSALFVPVDADQMAEVEFSAVGGNITSAVTGFGHDFASGDDINIGWNVAFRFESPIMIGWSARWYVDGVFASFGNNFTHTVTDDVEIEAVAMEARITTEVIYNAEFGAWNLNNRFGAPNFAGTAFVDIGHVANVGFIPTPNVTVVSGSGAGNLGATNSRTLQGGDWIRFTAPAPSVPQTWMNPPNPGDQWRLRWTVNGQEVLNRSNTTAPNTLTTMGVNGNGNNELFVRLDGIYHVTVERVPNVVNFSVQGTGGTLHTRIGNNPAAAATAANTIENGTNWIINNHAATHADGRVNFVAVPQDGYRVARWYVNGVLVVATSDALANAATTAAQTGRWMWNPEGGLGRNVLVRMPNTPGAMNVVVVFEPIPTP